MNSNNFRTSPRLPKTTCQGIWLKYVSLQYFRMKGMLKQLILCVHMLLFSGCILWGRIMAKSHISTFIHILARTGICHILYPNIQLDDSVNCRLHFMKKNVISWQRLIVPGSPSLCMHSKTHICSISLWSFTQGEIYCHCSEGMTNSNDDNDGDNNNNYKNWTGYSHALF